MSGDGVEIDALVALKVEHSPLVELLLSLLLFCCGIESLYHIAVCMAHCGRLAEAMSMAGRCMLFSFKSWVFVSTVNRRVAMCEHASPKPAMHVHTPPLLAAPLPPRVLDELQIVSASV